MIVTKGISSRHGLKTKGIAIVCIIALLITLLASAFLGYTTAMAKGSKANVSIGSLGPIWYRTFGGTDADFAFSITADDPSVYVAGWTDTNNTNSNAIVLRYDSNGNLLWNRTWNWTNLNEARSIVVDKSETYVFSGAFSGPGSADAVILKYDSNGNLLWNKTLDGENNEFGGGSLVLDDPNIYIAGGTEGDDAYLVKCDMNGNLLWNRTWGGSNNDWAYSIAADSSSIYIVGLTASYGAGCCDAFVLRYDMKGDLLWNRTWGGSNDDWAHSIAVDESGIYVTGLTQSYPTNQEHVFILKFDASGNLLWHKTWDGSIMNVGYSIDVDSSNIYIAGFTYDRDKGDDALLLRYDRNGNLLWSKVWGSVSSDVATSTVVRNGSIYVGGYTCGYGAGGYDMFVLKCNLEGDGGTALPVIEITVIVIAAIIVLVAIIVPLFLIRRNMRKKGKTIKK